MFKNYTPVRVCMCVYARTHILHAHMPLNMQMRHLYVRRFINMYFIYVSQ